MTSDGMLSCYTPFLLAIVKRRVADAAAAAAAAARAPPPPPPAAAATETEEAVSPSAEADVSGNPSGLSTGGVGNRLSPRSRSTAAVEEGGRGAAVEGRGGRPGGGGAAPSSSSCPGALCAEALWALSEYAVLSPGLGEWHKMKLTPLWYNIFQFVKLIIAGFVCAPLLCEG